MLQKFRVACKTVTIVPGEALQQAGTTDFVVGEGWVRIQVLTYLRAVINLFDASAPITIFANIDRNTVPQQTVLTGIRIPVHPRRATARIQTIPLVLMEPPVYGPQLLLSRFCHWR
jgi:hypothetical protein